MWMLDSVGSSKRHLSNWQGIHLMCCAYFLGEDAAHAFGTTAILYAARIWGTVTWAVLSGASPHDPHRAPPGGQLGPSKSKGHLCSTWAVIKA